MNEVFLVRRWSVETETRRSKNASRPSRDRDVRDRDYNPDWWSTDLIDPMVLREFCAC